MHIFTYLTLELCQKGQGATAELPTQPGKLRPRKSKVSQTSIVDTLLASTAGPVIIATKPLWQCLYLAAASPNMLVPMSADPF